ncbi:hypothetical protein AAMO2058_001068800 [Amorphochlora amoebiformis]
MAILPESHRTKIARNGDLNMPLASRQGVICVCFLLHLTFLSARRLTAPHTWTNHGLTGRPGVTIHTTGVPIRGRRVFRGVQTLNKIEAMPPAPEGEGDKSDRSRSKRMDDALFYFDEVDESLTRQVFGSINKTRSSRDSHDETIIRKRKGELLSIPQAKRYVSRDWLHILGQLPKSVTLKRIYAIVLCNVIWTIFIACINHFAFTFPKVASGHGPTLVTPALGLLLVFRTNAAYNRFWEGRQIWEKIIDNSRCLARAAVLYRKSAGEALVIRIGKLLSAFAIVLKQHLTELRLPESQFVEQVLLDKEDRVKLGRASNRPLCVLHMLGSSIHRIPDTDSFASRERLAMLRCVDKLTESMGSAERIVQTPVPLNYARHTSRFLTFWCLTLPIAVVGELGFATIPVMALVTWALYGIQEIGLMIEEPFRRSLSLNVFCNTIYTDTMETINALLPLDRRVKSPSDHSKTFPEASLEEKNLMEDPEQAKKYQVQDEKDHDQKPRSNRDSGEEDPLSQYLS